jgi:hypothetical protein
MNDSLCITLEWEVVFNILRDRQCCFLQCLMPVILFTHEAESRRIVV